MCRLSNIRYQEGYLRVVLLLCVLSIMRNGVFAFSLLRSTASSVRSRQGGRSVFLPPAAASVTGTVYEEESNDTAAVPRVTLFTREGCTLCDKVKDVLVHVRQSHPHSLDQIDITDDQHADWFDRYKYDIPVLHLNGEYWLKHRLSLEEAQEGLDAVREGRFESPRGEPNAKEMEST